MKTWLERQRYFIDFTIASLARRKTKNTALILCYALIVFLITSVLFFSGSLRHEAVKVLEGSPEILVQRVVAGRYAPIPLHYASEIERIRGVRRVEPRLWGYYFHPAAGANYTVMVSQEEKIADGKALVGLGVIRTWGIANGDTMYFKAFDGTAATLVSEQAFGYDAELFTSDLILVSEASFRRIFGFPEGMATDLALKVRNPKEWQTVIEKIVRIAPDARAITRDEIQRTYASLFDWRSGYVLVMLTGAVLAFLIFAVDKAAGLSAQEKNEIAILKAVGWETSDVLLLKFWEGFAISLCAYLIGVIAAYFHVFFFPAPLFEHALKGWSVLYPKFQPAPVFDAYDLAVVFAFTVVPYSFMTVVPSWKASVTDPDAVMRSS